MGGEDDEMGFKNGDETEVEITSMPLFTKVDPFFSSSDWDPVVSGLVSNNNFSTCHYPSLVMENPRINNGFAHYQTGSSSSYADMSTSLLPFGNLSACNQIDKKCENEDRFMRSREVHEDHQISEDSVLGTSPCRKRRHLELETVPSSQWNKKAVEESRKDEQMEDQSHKKMESEGKMVDDSGGKIPTKKENNSQNGEGTKENYIHVRARRGQATNSHSLAERVRREKISERMRLLQELVPGCNKITGKAVMLDEIINYVQSLQQQVEFLSMKLATVNPSLNIDIDRILAKDILHSRDRNIPILGLSNGMNLLHPYGVVQSTIPNIPTTNQQFNPSSQTVLDSELQSLYQMGYVSNSSNIDNFPSNGRLKPEL